MENWVGGVKRLAGFAILFHQTAYANLMVLIHKEWKFFSVELPVLGPFLHHWRRH